MVKADLHLHSNASDGVLSPAELAAECQRNGVSLMAITDHDTFAGSDTLRAQSSPVTLIPAVELSISDMHCLHLLGYGFSDAPSLRQRVATLNRNRAERARQIVDKLASMGMPLDWKALRRRYTGSIGRPHIARAMVHAGYVGGMQEAFEKYLAHGKPAYIASERLNMEEALQLLSSNGFAPVLAHPYELRLEDHLLYPLLNQWKEQGLAGVEVYHPSAISHGFAGLDRMARELDLLVTGGSDFHQANDKHGRIGSMADHWAQCDRDCNELLQRLDGLRR